MKKININSKLAEYATIKSKGKPMKGKCKKCGKPEGACKCKSC